MEMLHWAGVPEPSELPEPPEPSEPPELSEPPAPGPGGGGGGNRIPIVYQSYTIVYLIRAPGATWDFGGILARWASLAPFDFGAHCDIPHRTPYSSN